MISLLNKLGKMKLKNCKNISLSKDQLILLRILIKVDLESSHKIVYMLTNFDLVRQNSQEVIFSTQGSIMWGFIVAAVFVGQKYIEYIIETVQKSI